MNEDMQNELRGIKERNARVEADKAWEVSWTRRFFIAFVTYLTAGFFLTFIGESDPWFKAFVPVIGYGLSTASLPFVKNWWLTNAHRGKH